MAPQASLVDPTPTLQSSAVSTPHQTWMPAMLFIFLGLCLAYTFSYVLYRIIMSRRLASQDDVPDTPDRGVSQFMNGARLTLNFAHDNKSTPPTLNGSRNTPDEEKPLTDPSHPAQSEIPTSSPAVSSSSPFTLMPSLTIYSNQGLDGAQLGAEPPSTPVPAPAQQPFSQRIAAKVKLLSRDKAEAISLDPKLAPVQGPLRPLSMVPSPPRQQRLTLFGLGFKYSRGHGEGPETGTETEAQ
ncbi:hypothetical protein JVT61DRAFT_3613 [Boletus reticuloceps]|uniref:Transmembrane protein n=1 Tax=Boletus reticuloceps TaxID=495285 RepID=A0A8I2YLS4_9AGAM|nr:hypothetical protein JVT61DRAFT_3613 [Boletus reticuloceps]